MVTILLTRFVQCIFVVTEVKSLLANEKVLINTISVSSYEAESSSNVNEIRGAAERKIVRRYYRNNITEPNKRRIPCSLACLVPTTASLC